MRRGRRVGQRLPVVPVALQALRPCGAGLLKRGFFGNEQCALTFVIQALYTVKIMVSTLATAILL